MTNDERWEGLAEREMLGEPLTEEDRDFIAAHAASSELYAAELEVIRRLTNAEEEADDARERAIAERALEAYRSEGRNSVPDARVIRLRWVFAGALAAAAAAAVVFSLPRTEVPVAENAAKVRFARAEGAIVIDGVPASHPVFAPEGARIELVSGTACLEVGPSIITCLGEGTQLQLSKVTDPKRRVELLTGRVVVALDPQPADARFSVVAHGVWSTAVGTMYSVEVNDEGVVQTAVYEGKVRVGGEMEGDVVVAHKIGLSTGEGVEIESITEPDTSPEWVALEEVSGKRYKPPEPEAVALEDLPEAGPTGDAPPRTRAAIQEPPEAPVKSAGDMLTEARRLRADQRWADAVAAYREILQRHPSSSEAHAVLVSLGELELQRLGEPALALKRFDAYLAAGGPLAIEAQLGRIRAFRALGNTSAEAEAIEAFLAAHPNNLEAPALRDRQKTLGGR
jgi:hypothetical protein